MRQTAELRSAIEELYSAFAGYLLREDTEACPCCHTAQDEQRLHRKELRELDTEYLLKYSFDALFVWGGVDDFKHFLPRIFELITTHPDQFEIPVVLHKLHHGQWKDWPKPEHLAARSFLAAVWRCVVDGPSHEFYGMEVEDWLCGIAQAEESLSPYLDAWMVTDSENARLNLARFIAETDFGDPDPRPTAYWETRAESFKQIAVWVRGDAVKARIAKTGSLGSPK